MITDLGAARARIIASMTAPSDDEFLIVGIVQSRADLARIDEAHWYRIPVRSAPRDHWPPAWFAALEAQSISRAPAQVIRRFARVLHIREQTREQLFPGIPAGDRAGRVYYQLQLGDIQFREPPLQLNRPRRHAFIRTTREKFDRAVTVNDLFDDSKMEDELWEALKAEEIPAERQWLTEVGARRFFIDFALFCTRGRLAVEVDGKWHHNPEKAIEDDRRDTLLATAGWQIHHIPTRRILSGLREELTHLKQVINQKGGLLADGLVPRNFVDSGAVQYSLFEPRAAYDDPDPDDDP